jgi:lysozyme
MKIGQTGLDLIKSFEGCSLKAYLDMVGVPTIGFGYTKGVTHQDVSDKRTIDEPTAEKMLRDELSDFETGVSRCVHVPLNENEFSALVSFSYNLGLGSLERSTLLKLLNAGDHAGAANEFIKWNRAGGKPVDGLTRRRVAERDLFLKPVAQNSNMGSSHCEDTEVQLEDIDKEANMA